MYNYDIDKDISFKGSRSYEIPQYQTTYTEKGKQALRNFSNYGLWHAVFDLKALYVPIFGSFSLKNLQDWNKSSTFVATNPARFP